MASSHRPQQLREKDAFSSRDASGPAPLMESRMGSTIVLQIMQEDLLPQKRGYEFTQARSTEGKKVKYSQMHQWINMPGDKVLPTAPTYSDVRPVGAQLRKTRSTLSSKINTAHSAAGFGSSASLRYVEGPPKGTLSHHVRPVKRVRFVTAAF
ncbi:hypothetical protein NDU88_005794 [Pleurodeles waltl]|uniref:Uncharacterized protein n=1 Tax=Pleurodeles waltl TaxID=8319 RepID=A0AAV7RK50_PLEWA|nr:hypothetical protein NDU88_005794 [Pleurodeles waltl]